MSKEAGRLIIENISAIQEAHLLLTGELSEQVFRVVDETIESWAKKNDWRGTFSFLDDDDGTFFYPSEWQVIADEADGVVASFALASLNADDDREEWLTRLLGAGEERVCFWFSVEYGDLRFKKKQWKTFAGEQNEQRPEIANAGFQFNATEGTWSLPWKIDAKALADGWGNDTMEDAMEPLRVALERIKSVSSSFDEVVKAAREQAPQP